MQLPRCVPKFQWSCYYIIIFLHWRSNQNVQIYFKLYKKKSLVKFSSPLFISNERLFHCHSHPTPVFAVGNTKLWRDKWISQRRNISTPDPFDYSWSFPLYQFCLIKTNSSLNTGIQSLEISLTEMNFLLLVQDFWLCPHLSTAHPLHQLMLEAGTHMSTNLLLRCSKEAMSSWRGGSRSTLYCRGLHSRQSGLSEAEVSMAASISRCSSRV